MGRKEHEEIDDLAMSYHNKVSRSPVKYDNVSGGDYNYQDNIH